jgi:hypothetical protein
MHKINKKWTEKDFIIELNKIHPNLKLISEFTVLREYVKVEDELGIIYCSLAQSFLKNYPNIKSAINKTDAFIKRANNIHNNKYDYSKVIYNKSTDKISIICPIHGEFIQTANNHLNIFQGCPQCQNGGWGCTFENWINFVKDKSCIFYIIKCYNEDEEFIKIGITSNSIEHRFMNKKRFPYKYDIIWEVSTTGENVWNLEQEFKLLYPDSYYIPSMKFGGSTECYKWSEIFNIVNKLKLSLNSKIKNDTI